MAPVRAAAACLRGCGIALGIAALIFLFIVGACFIGFAMKSIDGIKARLHRDIVADPVLHGLVLNLYLNGEQYPHRVSDYFPLAAVEDPATRTPMRNHMADEDKHIALYTRAIEKLGQPVLVQPHRRRLQRVIRRHTPASFALEAGEDRDACRAQAGAFFRAPAFSRETRGTFARISRRRLRACRVRLPAEGDRRRAGR